MASPTATARQPSPATDPTVTASGFTPSQAAAIAGLVQKMTDAAAEALRHEIRWWHCYLAMYLLGQISLVLLAILMTQVLRDPPQIRTAAREGPPLIAHRCTTPIHSEHRVNRPRFEVHQSETAASEAKSLPAADPVMAPPRHPAND